MKKLVVLMLVVGMASLASADLTLSASGSDITDNGGGNYDIILNGSGVITLSSTHTGGIGTYVQLTDGDGDATIVVGYSGGRSNSYAALSNPTDLYNGNQDSYNLSYGYQVTSADSVTAPPPGAKWSFDLDALGSVGDTFQITADNWDDIRDTMNFTIVVPEPMTMALLGLGGLFLRRKK